jgi:hypothetical protein
MQHPLTSLFAAVILLFLGGMLEVPDVGVKAAHGPDGQVLRNANGRPVMVQVHHRDLRVNWAAYLCFAGGAASLVWALFLVVYGAVVALRRKPQPGAVSEWRPRSAFCQFGTQRGAAIGELVRSV